MPDVNRRRSQQQSRLAQFKKGVRYARQVVRKPHPYRRVSALTHGEPEAEWVERTIADPYTAHEDQNHPGRNVYYRFIPEAGEGKWLLVVVENDQLFNAYFNSKLLKVWGRPA